MKRNLLIFMLMGLVMPVAFAQGRLISPQPMPILAWSVQETTPERVQEIKDAGFTAFMGGGSTDEIQRLLDLSHKKELKVLIVPSGEDLEQQIRKFMNHPALMGYHLGDEPLEEAFAGLADQAKRIRAIDDVHPTHVNLFPFYANYTGGIKFPTYREYIQAFEKTVHLQVISYDNYSVLVGDSVRADYYENLEIISEEARKSGKPFWAFACSTALTRIKGVNGPYPVPTLTHLRFQLYSILLYGSQVLQYWPYWTPGGDSKWDFQSAPIGLDGKRTVVYDRIKSVNQEIQNLAGVFSGSKVVSLGHLGDVIPKATSRLKKLPKPFSIIDTGGAGALVSELENGENRFLVILNKSLTNRIRLLTIADESVKKVLKDGSIFPASLYSNITEIEPGDIAVFMFPTIK